MQRAVHDFVIAEAEHQIDVVRRKPRLARDEGGVAVERDAGERDRGLVLRGGDDRIDLALTRSVDRAAQKAIAARPPAALVSPNAIVAAPAAGTSTLSRGARPVRIGDLRDDAQIGVDPARAWPCARARLDRRPAIGLHAARTAGSSAALRLISGPMPAGSPVAMAILGFSLIPTVTPSVIAGLI